LAVLGLQKSSSLSISNTLQPNHILIPFQTRKVRTNNFFKFKFLLLRRKEMQIHKKSTQKRVFFRAKTCLIPFQYFFMLITELKRNETVIKINNNFVMRNNFFLLSSFAAFFIQTYFCIKNEEWNGRECVNYSIYAWAYLQLQTIKIHFAFEYFKWNFFLLFISWIYFYCFCS